jgi:hypothetical protein
MSKTQAQLMAARAKYDLAIKQFMKAQNTFERATGILVCGKQDNHVHIYEDIKQLIDLPDCVRVKNTFSTPGNRPYSVTVYFEGSDTKYFQIYSRDDTELMEEK